MKGMKRSIYSLVLLLAVSFFATADTGETKTAKFNYPVSESTDITVRSSNMDLLVEGWDKNEVQVIATLEFKGKETDRARKFLDSFEQLVENNIIVSSTSIVINGNLDEPNKVQVGSKFFGVQIGYDDDELMIRYEVKVPFGNNFDVKNSYKDLNIIGDFTGKVEIEHYSGDLVGGSFKDLELKWTDTQLTKNA